MGKLSRFAIAVTFLSVFFATMQGNSQPSSKGKDAEQGVKKIQELKEKKKKEREAKIKKLKSKLEPLMKFSIEELQLALTIKVTTYFNGAKIYADSDNRTYLGEIRDEFGSESIFNDFGTYGSEFSSKSIWNEFGTYGGEFSVSSPFNSFSSSPPKIVKGNKIIGRLTVNKAFEGAVDPNWLKSYFKY